MTFQAHWLTHRLQWIVLLALMFLSALCIRTTSEDASQPHPPTVVLVHGALAESSGWNAVIAKLLRKRYPVVAAANPLRGLKSDSAYVAGSFDAIDGPLILVGHSHGGRVISEAAKGKGNVKALIFVSGLAPDVGESASGLVGKYPGSALGPGLAPPVALANGGKDLYIRKDKYHAQSLDENIPPAVHAFMAKRAGAREAVEIKGTSHVVLMSHPNALVRPIQDAAPYGD